MSTKRRFRTRLNLLARVPRAELETIRVAVKRKHITTCGPILPIERSIDDPKLIVPLVHNKRDRDRRTSKEIFDREDIVVNQEDERLIMADANILEELQGSRSSSRSRSGSRRRKKRSRSRSSTPRSTDRGRNRRTSSERKNDSKLSSDKADVRSPNRGRDHNKENYRNSSRSKIRSPDRQKDDRGYRNREHSRERDSIYRKRSITPLRPGEYKPSHSDPRRRSKSRERGSKTRRSRSLSRDRYKPSTSHRKSISPSYHKSSTTKRLSRSPRRSHSPPPVRGDRGEPKFSRYGEERKFRSSTDRERKERDRTPENYDKNRSPPPQRYDKERRRSHSPVHLSKYDRNSRRSSRSPGRYNRIPADRRRSRSPHGRRPDYRRSRSPRDRDRRYRSGKERTRSRSPAGRSRSPRNKEPREIEFGYYEGIPGAEYWIPGPIRPGFAVPRFYPPPFYPRGILPMMPRMPIPYAPFRPRLPIYNSKPKIRPTQSTSVSMVPDSASSQITDDLGSSTNVDSGHGSQEESNVLIEEVVEGKDASKDADRGESKNTENAKD